MLYDFEEEFYTFGGVLKLSGKKNWGEQMVLTFKVYLYVYICLLFIYICVSKYYMV